MNQCDFCVSEPTCFDEPRDDCPDFRPNDEYRRNRIEEQVKEHDKRVRAEIIGWLFDSNMLYCFGQNLKEYDLLEKEEIIATIISIHEKEQKNY